MSLVSLSLSEIMGLAGLLWSVALTFYVQLGTGRHEIEGKIDSIKKDMNGIGMRITKCETQIAEGPSHRDLSLMHEKINLVAAELAKLRGASEGNTDLLKSIHNRMMENR